MRHGISPTREPDTGFSVAVAMWASGRSLAESLMAAGEAGQLPRRVISSAGTVRSSICSTRSPDAPVREMAGRAAIAAIGAIRRGGGRGRDRLTLR